MKKIDKIWNFEIKIDFKLGNEELTHQETALHSVKDCKIVIRRFKAIFIEDAKDIVITKITNVEYTGKKNLSKNLKGWGTKKANKYFNESEIEKEYLLEIKKELA